MSNCARKDWKWRRKTSLPLARISTTRSSLMALREGWTHRDAVSVHRDRPERAGGG